MFEDLRKVLDNFLNDLKSEIITFLSEKKNSEGFVGGKKCDAFFTKMDNIALALSYGDVRLRTCYSDIVQSDTILKTRFSRNVGLNIPIISSPMDTVTEVEMAIAMAKLGGLGIIHKGLDLEKQAKAVAKVKHYLSAFISDPITIRDVDTVEKVLKMREDKGYGFSSFPVADECGHIVGIATRSYFDFCRDNQNSIAQIMSKEILSIPDGASIEQAYEKMMEEHVRILPVFDGAGAFKGIYTLRDVKRIIEGNSVDFNLSLDGTLRVGAAIGVGADAVERMKLLAEAKVDVVVVDTAHGDSRGVIDTLKFCKKEYPHIDVVAGNVSEGDSAKRLADAGVDGVRVGQGPGSICTTRVIAGVGCPQVTAIYNCAKALRSYDVPVCGDGGIEYSGDITIGLGVGASCIMLGKLLAGTTESPGEIINSHGERPVKVYRGMGSLGAMLDNKASRERYGQVSSVMEKLVPEGVEGFVHYKGDVGVMIYQLLGGLRSGMGYLGSRTIANLQENTDLYQISPAGSKESHPHGLQGMKNAPNYSL